MPHRVEGILTASGIVAASGIYEHGLTVSGLPVSTGEAGVTDHSALANLDYATSGHTGFASGSDLAAVTASGAVNASNLSSHTGDSSIHFSEASIDHTVIQNVGTNTHAQIDSHITDGALHFTEGGIDHGSIAGLSDDDHTQYHNDARGDARYSQLGHGHAASDITSGSFADVRISESSVTQHQGAIDHGSLVGLADDDHTIYTKVDGTRAFTGNQSLGGNDLTNVGEITATSGTVSNLGVSGNATVEGTVLTDKVAFGEGGDLESKNGNPRANIYNGGKFTISDATGGSEAGFRIERDISEVSGNAAGWDFKINNSGSFIIREEGWGRTRFSITRNSSFTNLLGLDGSGQVGLGTFTPTEQIHLDATGGNILLDGDVQANTLTVSGVPVNIGESGVSDHGALTGLSDNDHPQYSRIATDESISGNWDFPNGATVSGAPVLTGFTGLVEPINMFIPIPISGSMTLVQSSTHGFTVDEMTAETDYGTVTGTLSINGTEIEGLDNMVFNTSESTSTATSANTVSAGDKLTISVSGTLDAEDWGLTIKTTRL